jgi:two-component system chemotaxis response regulator CheB
VVGTSRGGLNALKTLLAGLASDFSLPVAVVQHRDANSPPGLAQFLQQYSALPVAEVHDKDEIQAGRVYLAPPGYHLLVEESSFALSTDTPVHFARPSIDVLFESATDTFEADVIGVALTGSTEDGAAGLARIVSRGGLAIVEDPATAASPTLPAAAIAATRSHHVLPLGRIGPFLSSLLVLATPG